MSTASTNQEIDRLIEALASFAHGDNAAILSMDMAGTRLFHVHPLPWSVGVRDTAAAVVLDAKGTEVCRVRGLMVGSSAGRMMVAALNAMWKSLVPHYQEQPDA